MRKENQSESINTSEARIIKIFINTLRICSFMLHVEIAGKIYILFLEKAMEPHEQLDCTIK